MDGGAGVDTWIADQSTKTTAVLFNAADSQTTAQGALSGLAISKIETVNLTTGSGNDNINTSAYAYNDTVNTGAGNDTVYLGKGFDIADGGAGVDTLYMSITTATSDITYTSGSWNTYADVDETQSIQFTNFEIFKLYSGRGNDTL